MDSIQYREIMAKYMLPFAQEHMAEGWQFQQDNDPKHKAAALMGGSRPPSQGWFAENGVKVLEWPSQSPDLNPIEHLWAHVGRQLKGKRFRNKDDLFAVLKSVWENISIDILIKLIDSMPRRCKAVLLANGYATKY